MYSLADFFLKKDCNYRNNCGIRLHDADLEILKMLIRVCLRDVLQPAV